MQTDSSEPARYSSRLFTVAYWSIPSLLLIVLYWQGLKSSYFRDDFAWLALPQSIHDFPSLLTALFQPYAQGSIRPISERLFFILGWLLFGMDALPLRVIVFATQIANLVVLSVVARRLTGSAVAGFAAPLLWLVNPNLFLPMTWTSAYNQILCALVLLLGFYLFLRYVESGKRRFYILQWVVYVLGLGVLELAVVYPALIGLYAWCCARRYLRSTLPFFAASVVYALVHQSLRPAHTPEAYRMYFDLGIFKVLGQYISWAAGAARYADYLSRPVWPHYVAQGLVLGALGVFVVAKIRRREWLAVVLAGWFFLVLAPVLPLQHHMSEYYLTIPVIGLALLGAWGLSSAVQAGMKYGVIAIAIALVYALPSAWQARGMTREMSGISRRARTFVASVAYAHKLHPGKMLLLNNVDSELYWSAWRDRPFLLSGLNDVYMTEASAAAIEPKPPGGAGREVLSDRFAFEALRAGRLVTYEVLRGDRLRNTTLLYEARLARTPEPALNGFLDAGRALSAAQLGSGWWPLDGPSRWMAGKAEVKLRGPHAMPGELIVEGICPEQHMAKGPITLRVSVDGAMFPAVRIDRTNLHFRFTFPLPVSVAAKHAIDVTIETDRTLVAGGDPRQLGLAFGTFEVRP